MSNGKGGKHALELHAFVAPDNAQYLSAEQRLDALETQLSNGLI